MSDQDPVTIDIVSDVVCPWCYLGKSNLEKALQDYGDPVIIRWHPFQLDPTIPREAQGLKFDFEAIEKSPNTLDAHRLIQWAGENGTQDQIVDALFKAYFEQGRDIGDPSVLIEIATAHGFVKSEIEKKLMGDDDITSVRAEIEEAQRLGISGVPFFIFNRKLAASGAQPPDQLLAAIKQAQA